MAHGQQQNSLWPEWPMIPWVGPGGVIISHFHRSLDSLQDSAPTLALDAGVQACTVGPVGMVMTPQFVPELLAYRG